jgi:hypothetical protein
MIQRKAQPKKNTNQRQQKPFSGEAPENAQTHIEKTLNKINAAG